ncbi:hypothetical protein ACXJJ3_19560 [Kribbella sp. WER1]
MHRLLRRASTVAVVLLLTACGTAKRPAVPSPSVPPTSTASPSPATFRYNVNQLQTALPVAVGRHRFESSIYTYPVSIGWTLRADPLDGWTVVPAECRAIIWNGGHPGRPGDFIAPETPSASATAELGPRMADDLEPNLRVSVIELTGALADKYLDMFKPTPAECAHVTVNGAQRASAVERAVPGFGERSRFIARSFPALGKAWTEHILNYRTSRYVVEVRWDGESVPDSAFLAFARKTRDRLTAALKG